MYIYSDALQDFTEGLFNSLRIDKIIRPVYYNLSLRKLLLKICKYNLVMHILPALILIFFNGRLLYPIIYAINIFSIMFHLLHYMDLTNIMSGYIVKSSKNIGKIEIISLAITMSIYQLVMYLTTTIIFLIFHDRMYWVSVCLNFFITTIYHSFYCYNNLWHCKKMQLAHRINIHEKMWPYYLGYGTFATIIYTYTDNLYVLVLYNLYLCLVIMLPFIMEIKYPRKEQTYPQINLFIFSYITGWIFNISKYITNVKTNDD
ncbi:MAG: putative etoposide-induced protein 2.4 [Satyrvirus sp.]|uniref:Putative etoposide-induced protein 2.4 n=1 Tax=Satyrvirus sp. TaxID=2487771 RepID=A0A3G5AIH9_9VIRU|nr:MAG: putative etoposide-induced protein 2.4 [Satyrvirus sp.]